MTRQQFVGIPGECRVVVLGLRPRERLSVAAGTIAATGRVDSGTEGKMNCVSVGPRRLKKFRRRRQQGKFCLACGILLFIARCRSLGDVYKDGWNLCFLFSGWFRLVGSMHGADSSDLIWVSACCNPVWPKYTAQWHENTVPNPENVSYY